ncbi:crossover junction endodeoxyribonuclease RuvC [Candidatus Woesebacteria bacterium]|nr:crossover junction endodeoxyribonuclease RuvC [Candidatus Woesebacteria bacterium]
MLRTTNQNLKILGIDPGYDRVGWAVGIYKNSKFEVEDLGCIQTNKKDDIFGRYNQIINELQSVIEKFSPNSLAIEMLYFAKNKKTALRVSEARGVIISIALNSGLEVFEYSPNEIKLAVTGSGAADKQAVEKMVKMQISYNLNGQIDDAIDALAVAMTHGFNKY